MTEPITEKTNIIQIINSTSQKDGKEIMSFVMRNSAIVEAFEYTAAKLIRNGRQYPEDMSETAKTSLTNAIEKSTLTDIQKEVFMGALSTSIIQNKDEPLFYNGLTDKVQQFMIENNIARKGSSGRGFSDRGPNS